MKRIAVIGNSLTALNVIDRVRDAEGDAIAVFVSAENTFPYHRGGLPGLILKKTTPAKVQARSAADLEKSGIRFVFDKKLTRVNFRKSRLTLDDKETIEYDYLIISDGFLPAFHGVKGANKTGLYHLKRLEDMSALLKALPVIETLAIESDRIGGLSAALSLTALPSIPPKEVLLITSGEQPLSRMLSTDDAVRLSELINRTALRVIARENIAEILGDTEAKAIRLASGKVFGCQAVLTDSDIADLRLFKESGLLLNERVAVNEDHLTNFENVFAVDSLCDRMNISDWDISLSYPFLVQAQSEIIAAVILKKERPNIEGPARYEWDIPSAGETVSFAIGLSGEKQLKLCVSPIESPQTTANAA